MCTPDYFAPQSAWVEPGRMADGPGIPPFMTAWLQGQQAFAQFAGSGFAGQSLGAGTERFFADQYRQLFAMPGLQMAAPRDAAPGPLLLRYQQAAERFGRLLNEAALDAARRLGAVLADDAPGSAPVTSLRQLHGLWIDCGEAAWSAVAHREEFAAAQADLFATLVALRATVPAP
jgi:hypothetical protein